MPLPRAEFLIEDLDKHKEWHCKNCNAVIGYIVKHNHICHLVITDRGIISTGNAKIRCNICGKWQEWFWDKFAVDQLIEHVRKLNA